MAGSVYRLLEYSIRRYMHYGFGAIATAAVSKAIPQRRRV
jgi:hypothetical protein